MRASERINERRVLPSLWPDGAGYGLDRILEGADLPSVWLIGARTRDGGLRSWIGKLRRLRPEPSWGRLPAGAGRESRWLLAHLQYWTHRLLGHAGLHA